MSQPIPVPPGSLLAAYARQGAFVDCYRLTVPDVVSLPVFIEAFYTTRLFKLERWVLARALKLPSSDEQARQLAMASVERFAAWKTEQRSDDEILLDAGRTRSWLSVSHAGNGSPATTLLFGSAVVPRSADGRMGLAFHALLGFHRLYSKLLLNAAARRIRARRGA